MTQDRQRTSSVAAALALTIAALAGCSSVDYSADLATNELLYADVAFVTTAPGDVEVFLAPVQDLRDPSALPLHDGGYPIRYGSDEFWERPVAVMLSEVLQRQLAQSELFAAVVARAQPQTVVVKPSVVTFHVGAQEGMAGAMSFAEVGLRVEVLGPVGPDGARPVWHDQTYGNLQRTEHEVNPVSPYRLIGRALQVTMSGALAGLDGSNVARSDVPVTQPARAAAEASATKR
ncbi:MAG: hypothetical protein ACON4Z_10780 [Planctomycetota bacterium]